MVYENQPKNELLTELHSLQQECIFLKDSSKKKIDELNLSIDLLQTKMANCEAIFESSPIAMFIIDETTNVVMVNLAAIKLCGGNEEEILQHRPGNALRCVHSAKDPRGCGYAPDCSTCEVRNGIEALIAKGGTINGAELEFNLTQNGEPHKVWMNVGVEPLMKDSAKHWCIAMNDITPKKLAEEALRISEERFHSIFNNLQDAFFQADLSGNFTLVSPSAIRMYGYDTLEEMIGMPASNLYADIDVRNQLINELRSKGEITDFLGEGKRKDGSTFWVSMNIRLMYKNGKVWGTEGIVRDITERVQTEQKLTKSKTLLKSIIDSTSDMIWSVDAERFGLLNWNTSFHDYFLNDRGIEISIGNVPADLFPVDSEYIVFWTDLFRRTLEEGSLSVEYVTFSGNRALDMTLHQLKQEGKTYGISIFAKEITEKKNAEKEIIRAKEKTEESEYRLKLATASGRLGIWDWNLKENTMVWDDRMFELYGITPDTFPNNIDAWTNGLHPEDKQRALDECNAALNGEKEYNTSFRVLQPDGTVLFLKANGSVLRDETGKPIRMIGINRDITENQLAAKQLLIEKEKAEESDRLKSAFLANMSHEIRTPLNSIIGFSELLNDPDFEPEQRNEFTKIIIENGNNLLVIISDIMDLSMLDARQIKIRNEKFHAKRLISDLANEHKTKASNKGIEFNSFYSNDVEDVIINNDIYRIRQIFNNLIGNALKFTTNGSIEIGYYADKSIVTFYVKDSGIGIAPEFHKDIFKRFRQVDETKTRKYGGNGLGLSISKNLVEVLGGKIWVESKVGKGSTFYFSLPINLE